MAKSFLARRRYTTNGDGGETVRTKARAAIQILSRPLVPSSSGASLQSMSATSSPSVRQCSRTRDGHGRLVLTNLTHRLRPARSPTPGAHVRPPSWSRSTTSRSACAARDADLMGEVAQFEGPLSAQLCPGSRPHRQAAIRGTLGRTRSFFGTVLAVGSNIGATVWEPPSLRRTRPLLPDGDSSRLRDLRCPLRYGAKSDSEPAHYQDADEGQPLLPIKSEGHRADHGERCGRCGVHEHLRE